ncbi:MAG TPA: NAD-dependent malic enzyme [Acidimicrobiia bacterium]|nr:NAD-dependent malic enzyme [Acidimicrobiia bacterium]
MRTSWQQDGEWHTRLRGRQVFGDPRINKGTGFTPGEREALGLTGLMPYKVFTLEQQATRSYAQYSAQPTPLAKNVFLTALHDRNEVLFYRLLTDHLREMLPIVYTPTIGEAIERYSHQYRRPRGVYLSVDAPELIESSLAATNLDPDEVDLIVATDAEAILGIGDWGVGGIAIAEGKLVVYCAAGGIDPNRAIPVILDVGTNRQELLDDPLYLGNAHPRVDQATYDRFIDAYVTAATKLFPDALLHWEDFGADNAHRILDRYKDKVLTFNDDIEGTGAVNLAAVLSGVAASSVPLPAHRIVIFGTGSAGAGIADQLIDAMVGAGLSEADALARIWAMGRPGLLTDDLGDRLRGFQRRYARPAAEVAGWARDEEGRINLEEVVRQVQPTILVGTSTQAGAFTEPVVRTMAQHCERPIILPLSNPTRLAEATPENLLRWTDGRALVATGSPFDPVTHDKVTYVIGQANNALIFPGLGLGAIVARASRMTDSMIFAAAEAVAGMVDSTARGASLLPQINDVRETSVAVAAAVARAAAADGCASAPLDDDLETQVRRAMWEPVYRAVRPA